MLKFLLDIEIPEAVKIKKNKLQTLRENMILAKWNTISPT